MPQAGGGADMSTYRMGSRSAFPHMPRLVAWLVSCDESGAFVFAASWRRAKALGSRELGYCFDEVRAVRARQFDDLGRRPTPREVIERGWGYACERCETCVYDGDEPEFDEHGDIVSCLGCREEES